MDFEIKTLTLAEAASTKTDALVVLLRLEQPGPVAAKAPKPARDALSVLVAEAVKAGDFEAKAGKMLAAYQPAGTGARRVLLAGIGDGSAKSVRKAVTGAIGSLKSGPSRKVTVLFATAPEAGAVRAAVLAAGDACYVYTATKSKPEPVKLETITFGVPDAALQQQAFALATGTAAGIGFAREWGNKPANYATPTLLADAARTLARKGVIECEVLGPREVAKLGMGSFMAVSKGSEEPLRFIVLKYMGGPRAAAPVVLVGKGITFDTGGISIKPASEMDEMKFDMCGAASVMGVFRALADIKPAVNVIGLIPAAENMPDGRALKPGDVVTSMSGQTIEVLNTDAEGRLVLCDALTYAERFKPAAVVDIATLTGACVIALGGVRSGLFSTNDALAAALHSAGELALDPCWRMPLDEEYAEGLKTNFADVANVAGRAGGAITAAKFLQRFTASFPWAHLDIAGTAWKGGPAKGSTGRPVGLLIEYLLAQVGASQPAAKAVRVRARG